MLFDNILILGSGLELDGHDWFLVFHNSFAGSHGFVVSDLSFHLLVTFLLIFISVKS